jgi:hypothetical protein
MWTTVHLKVVGWAKGSSLHVYKAVNTEQMSHLPLQKKEQK